MAPRPRASPGGGARATTGRRPPRCPRRSRRRAAPAARIPATSRLEPDTICPAASSSTAVVRAAPGGRRRARPPSPHAGLGDVLLTASALSADTEKAATTGTGPAAARARPTERSTPPARRRQPRQRHQGARASGSAQPHREHRVADDARERPVTGTESTDFGEPAEPVGGADWPRSAFLHHRRGRRSGRAAASWPRDVVISRAAGCPTHRHHHVGRGTRRRWRSGRRKRRPSWSAGPARRRRVRRRRSSLRRAER